MYLLRLLLLLSQENFSVRYYYYIGDCALEVACLTSDHGSQFSGHQFKQLLRSTVQIYICNS